MERGAKNYADQSPRIQAEELLAIVAQGRYSKVDSYFNKILAAIRRVLINVGGIKPGLGRSDLMNVVYQMGNAFEQRKRTRTRDLDKVLSTEANAETFYSAVQRAVNSLKQAGGAPS